MFNLLGMKNIRLIKESRKILSRNKSCQLHHDIGKELKESILIFDFYYLELECNRLAAEILVPSEKINLSDYINLELVDKMEYLANAFKVTYSTAAVCLRRLNFINQSELSHLLTLRRIANEKEILKKKGGDVRIPRENLMRLDLGRPMFNLVLDAYSSGALNIFDASKILNLRVNKIDKLISGTS